MHHVILADIPAIRENLLPLTFTRPVCELLAGADTIRDKWQRAIPGAYSFITAPHLSELFPTDESQDGDNLIISSHILPSRGLAAEISALKIGEALTDGEGGIIARRGHIDAEPERLITATTEVQKITNVYDLFLMCGSLISSDFQALTSGMKRVAASGSCTVIGSDDNLFIEERASVEGAIINVTHGPVLIRKNAEIMEGACLRGPIIIGEASTVNMGTRIYGPTTIGAHCKVGGELNNVVMHPYSNKAHDGFLGNAVIGSWCNLGAGCTASNLKNDYTEIKLWNYPSRRFLRTGLQFCGLIMGDHSKAGINTMFNTATVAGVGVNIHGTGFPRNFLASFSEGSAAGLTDVPLSKFMNIARRVMARRGIELTAADERMYTTLYEMTETYR